ncbi:MAG: hypothetical protein ACHQQS_06750 [Thermoanaerobaculales bacterium]
MNKACVVVLALGLVFGVASAAAGMLLTLADQAAPFQVTPQFTAAENVVDELTGTPATDPESQARLQQARAVFQAALDQSPKSTLALNYLARTYSFAGQDMALGIATFEKSLDIDPNQPNTIAWLVDLCLDAGQRSKAGQIQARLVNHTANPQLAAKVERLIGVWDCKEGQRLINAGQANEGLALMDKAIQNSLDPEVQASLREMRTAASREWEVSLYNEALAKVKAKDYRGAWDILEKLLPAAKDPEVVDRARRLRDKLVPVIAQTPRK